MMFLNIKPIPSGPELGIRPCNNTSPSTEQFNFIKSYFESKMNTTTTDSGSVSYTHLTLPTNREV